MNRFIIHSVVAVLLLRAALPVAAQQRLASHTLLWEISGKKLGKPSYIFGTVHVIPTDSFFIAPSVEQKMKQAEQLVMEREYTKTIAFDFTTQMSSMSGLMLTPPNSLRTLVGEENYPALKRFVRDSLHLDMTMTNAMKPFYVSQQIALKYCLGDDTQSYETYFADRFSRMGKTIMGLETVEEQRQYLDSIPLNIQVKEMMQNIRNPHALCTQYEEMVGLYRKQNVQALYEFSRRGQGPDGYMNILLDHRNKAWFPVLEKMMRRNSTFLAVGVAHLGGDNGLIQLFRNAGYTVIPVQ